MIIGAVLLVKASHDDLIFVRARQRQTDSGQQRPRIIPIPIKFNTGIIVLGSAISVEDILQGKNRRVFGDLRVILIPDEAINRPAVAQFVMVSQILTEDMRKLCNAVIVQVAAVIKIRSSINAFLVIRFEKV